VKIKLVKAREILDSRGIPTISCSVILEDGRRVESSVPSGASVGKYEAIELRDNDRARFNGKGVLKAIENIEKRIAPLLIDREPDVIRADKWMIELDGTGNKSVLGANATLAVSQAIARAQALVAGVPVYNFLHNIFGVQKKLYPEITCMFNILNGGMHADNKISFQEFMIMPKGFETISESIHAAVLVYQKLKELLVKKKLSSNIGDEGGFAPYFEHAKNKEESALDFILMAIEQAGFRPGQNIMLCLDVAASHFYDQEKKLYFLQGSWLSCDALIDYYKKLVQEYPIYSIEDPIHEDDWVGWEKITHMLGQKAMIVGDDIFVTNSKKIGDGIAQNIANAVLIKPNQVGTISEAYQAVFASSKSNYQTVASHRSGETNDSFIADFAVGCGVGYIKAGAPARGERVAKYNRLMVIERDFL